MNGVEPQPLPVRARLRSRFRAWLDGLDDAQAAALDDNWDNVMDDAALDRVDSWVIADRVLAEIRAAESPLQ